MTKRHEVIPQHIIRNSRRGSWATRGDVMGGLHHTVQSRATTAADVQADLRNSVTGGKPGRQRPEEIIGFDSTGSAVLHVASAVLVHKRATHSGVGTTLSSN